MVTLVRRGFTLIELLVVLSIVALLLTLALPRYFSSIERSKEAVLKENLNQMRDSISRYYADKSRYPESLDALVADKYLRKVPLDPTTDSAASWLLVPPEDALKGGVYDVRSAGKGYEAW
jgi:general secretion pathway protein G